MWVWVREVDRETERDQRVTNTEQKTGKDQRDKDRQNRGRQRKRTEAEAKAETDWFVCGETDAEGRKPDRHIDIGKPVCGVVLCCGPWKRQCKFGPGVCIVRYIKV
ncbi:hypothetical protein Pmani_031931 [Petrolisthes manimaculis]|uniref:Uncharacterized protein n=1 Tax=Petrolisthes manimaculis TaxID=1843537 RepID=A0AAE1NTM8_9EUCA|nr:hypothetical protein Pmani_031931 [Petrolisthes manimaculis]